ncbi:hypothetical protein OUZ56_002936 [Daphnia magna]|uniref:Uncharacterized protein n=1 Tax=Daphnia magna TaxID=35525 RepID=A0ABR0A787_9CRUS|nr:hypothetical protein OUZ56_002936 [Daphnia magna]
MAKPKVGDYLNFRVDRAKFNNKANAIQTNLDLRRNTVFIRHRIRDRPTLVAQNRYFESIGFN